MHEINIENTDKGMYTQPFKLTCSRCKYEWSGENEAAVQVMVESGNYPCKCTQFLDGLSQEELQAEINGVMEYDSKQDSAVIPANPVPPAPKPLEVVDW